LRPPSVLGVSAAVEGIQRLLDLADTARFHRGTV
jgi:hypothetical protein